MTAPCRGCQDRTTAPNCHMICERYLAYREQRERMCAERMREKEIQYARGDSVWKASRAALKRKKSEGR